MKGKAKKNKVVSGAEFKDALIKKALGYDAVEVVEEYVSCDEGEIKLSKKKVTKKNVPPDLSAIKILMEEQAFLGVTQMSDQELEEEKNRLLKILSAKSKQAD